MVQSSIAAVTRAIAICAWKEEAAEIADGGGPNEITVS